MGRIFFCYGIINGKKDCITAFTAADDNEAVIKARKYSALKNAELTDVIEVLKVRKVTM